MTKMLRLALCGILLLMVACASLPSPTPTSPPPTPTAMPPTATHLPPTGTLPAFKPDAIAEVEAWLSQQGKDGLFSGSVLVAYQGEVLLSQGYGLADREQDTPNTPQTRFRLGSITKQFTAMAILILQSQGKLNVKDPICNYVADCPAAWEPITIDQLLTHTSGIPSFTSFPDYLSTRATPASPEQTIARFKDSPLDFPPGEQWNYSNSGYVVLGYIIEQVSGQAYEAFLQQFIFTPLNMTDTGYDHNSNGLAVGYTSQYSDLPADFIDMSIPYAAGALYSTVEDLYRWDQALYTEQLLPQAQLGEMFVPQATVGEGWSYGYGWIVGQQFGQTVVSHNGGIEGFRTIIARFPDNQATVIVLSNREDQNVDLILQIIAKKLFGE